MNRPGNIITIVIAAIVSGITGYGLQASHPVAPVALEVPSGLTVEELFNWCNEHNNLAWRNRLNNQGRNWVQGCDNNGDVQATPSPTPAPSPTPSPSPTPTSSPTPSPTPPPSNEWETLKIEAGTDGVLAPMACPLSGYVRLGTTGQVLQNVSLDHCAIEVAAPNVIIRNVKIGQTDPELWAIRLLGNATGVQITDVECFGYGRTTASVQYCVYLNDGASVTITRANFHLCADCVQGEHVVMTDSWMHDFANIPGVSHVDGFQCNSTCEGTRIIHNLINVDQDQTGAVSLFQDFGVPRDVIIERNWLIGAGWTIYGGAGTRGTPNFIRILSNIVDRGQFGWLAYWNPNGLGNQCSGNRSSAGVALTC